MIMKIAITLGALVMISLVTTMLALLSDHARIAKISFMFSVASVILLGLSAIVLVWIQ